jgi:hypothetical protein
VDVNARKHASDNQLVAVDLMGAIVEWVEEGLLERSKAMELTVVWDDRVQERGGRVTMSRSITPTLIGSRPGDGVSGSELG